MTYNGMDLDKMTPKQRYYWKNRERLLEENKQRYYEKNKDSIEERQKIIEEKKEKKRLVEQKKVEQKKQKKLKEELAKEIKDLEFIEAKEVVENKFNTTFLEAIPNLSYAELESLFIKAACDCRAGEFEQILKKKVMTLWAENQKQQF